MAGLVQLEATGLQDKYFTEDPQYTYFIKNFKKHTNYSKSFININPETETDFGQEVRFVIPNDLGDMIKTVSLKLTLPNLETSNTCYIESIGHAIIERIDLIIGGKIIESIPSDYFQIFSEQCVTQTKQWALQNLVGKYPKKTAATKNSSRDISLFLGESNKDLECFIDIPFYFFNKPELAIPLCAITKQYVEVEVKFRDLEDLIIYDDGVDGTHVSVLPDKRIKSVELNCEMVYLDTDERNKMMNMKKDYIITQIQQNIFSIPVATNEFKCKTSFINPVKELYFIIQRENKKLTNDFCHPFDYDNQNVVEGNKLIFYEQLKYLKLYLNNEEILNEITGNYTFLKAVQSAIHHSRCQLIRRFYSYSFSLEPEKHTPTGQVNMSLVKDQNIHLSLNSSLTHSRELRVYAQSYNILRVGEGFAKTIFNS